ncbi:hypothetical protein L7F22_056446 [Adiantum nelumboides]|nr:hypothetical protein [Adiantum nelumboides]
MEGWGKCLPAMRTGVLKRPGLRQHTRGVGQREFGEVCMSCSNAGAQGTAEAKVGLVRLARCAEQLAPTELQKQRRLNELKLAGSDLTDADLRGADLSLTNAAKANFTNANLEGALVTGNTSFKGAVITGADFTDVLFRDDQRNYLCSIADGVNSTTGNATRDTLGC